MNDLEKLKEKAKIELNMLNALLKDIDEAGDELTIGRVLAFIKGRKEGLEKVIKWGDENA